MYITQNGSIALGTDLPSGVSSLTPREVLQLLGAFVDSLAVGWPHAYYLCEMQSFLVGECLKLSFSLQYSGLLLRSPYCVFHIYEYHTY